MPLSAGKGVVTAVILGVGIPHSARVAAIGAIRAARLAGRIVARKLPDTSSPEIRSVRRPSLTCIDVGIRQNMPEKTGI
jgi:hypothetical protein